MTRGSYTSTARRLLRLGWRDRAVLAEAALLLALARAAVVLLPFRITARAFGARMAETPTEDTAERADLRRIAWAISAVALRTPWRSKCLEQAIAAKAMLRRRGIASTLYLGVAKPSAGNDAPLEAHAWLRSGAVHVTGGARVDRYAVVASFADGPGRT